MQFRPCPFRAEASGRKFPQSSGKCSFFRLRQKDGHGDLCAIVRVPEKPAVLFQLQLYTLKKRIGAGKMQHAPRAQFGDARVVQRVLRGLRIGPAEPARAEQDAAELHAQHLRAGEDPLAAVRGGRVDAVMLTRLSRFSYHRLALYLILCFLQDHGVGLITTEYELRYILYLRGFERTLLDRAQENGCNALWAEGE